MVEIDLKCIYCSEEKATKQIISPNFDDDDNPLWNVCNICDEVIKLQQKLSFGILSESITMVDEANKELKKIAELTGKPIMTGTIYKKEDSSYDTMSIEFTGEK